GGRLVVADPGSAVTEMLAERRSPLLGPLFEDQALQPGCVSPEVVGVRRIQADPRDQVLESDGPGAVPCFSTPRGAYEVSVAYGRGSVILLGGSSFLVNERLARADDGLFAVQLVGFSGPVVFGPALPPGGAPAGGSTIWGALPDGARSAIVALGLALVALGLAR